MNEYLKVNEKVYNQLAEEYLLRREKPSKFEEATEYLGNSVFKYISKKSQKMYLKLDREQVKFLVILRRKDVEQLESSCQKIWLM